MVNVLIIDDSLTMRKMLEAMFKDMKFNVIATAGSGKEGIELYSKHKPDLVTMDINMPAMSGLEALKNIRDKFKDANILMLTSKGDTQSVTDAIKYGAKGYILKPPSKEKLKENIISIFPNAFTSSIQQEEDLNITHNETAIKDALTGLYSVQYMHHTIEHLVQIHNKYSEMEIGLLLVNINNLDDIEEKEGKMDRDIALTKAADKVLESIFATDIAVRLTNCELGVFIMGTSTKDIKSIAQKLTQSIASIKGTKLDISVGMAIHKQKEKLISFIERADGAIRQAHESGKEKIFMAK